MSVETSGMGVYVFSITILVVFNVSSKWNNTSFKLKVKVFTIIKSNRTTTLRSCYLVKSGAKLYFYRAPSEIFTLQATWPNLGGSRVLNIHQKFVCLGVICLECHLYFMTFRAQVSDSERLFFYGVGSSQYGGSNCYILQIIILLISKSQKKISKGTQTGTQYRQWSNNYQF